MDVKKAVDIAKSYIIDLFKDEELSNLGLEEVELDETNEWYVTLGFSRPWDKPNTAVAVLAGGTHRSYKTVRISDQSGAVLSVKTREVKT